MTKAGAIVTSILVLCCSLHDYDRQMVFSGVEGASLVGTMATTVFTGQAINYVRKSVGNDIWNRMNDSQKAVVTAYWEDFKTSTSNACSRVTAGASKRVEKKLRRGHPGLHRLVFSDAGKQMMRKDGIEEDGWDAYGGEDSDPWEMLRTCLVL